MLLLALLKYKTNKSTALLKHSLEPVVQINVQKKQRHRSTKQPNSAILYYPAKWALGPQKQKQYFNSKSVYLAYNINTNTILQFIAAVGSPEWIVFTLMDHQYPRLCVAVANTYWIIDVFGYPSLSTITASIRVVAWLMVLYAKSYPRKPLRSQREATVAVEIYMATIEAHFLFKC